MNVEEVLDYYNQLKKDQIEGDWIYSPLMLGSVNRWSEVYRKKHEGSLISRVIEKEGFHNHWFDIIKKFCPNIETVLEVGGKEGHLCGLLLPQVKRYYFLDLPEFLPYSKWFLNRTFPKFNSVVFLPPWELPKVEDKIDLFINTRSFQHMTKGNVDYYLKEVQRLKPKYLFLCNRTNKENKWESTPKEYLPPNGYEERHKEEGCFLTTVYEKTANRTG